MKLIAFVFAVAFSSSVALRLGDDDTSALPLEREVKEVKEKVKDVVHKKQRDDPLHSLGLDRSPQPAVLEAVSKPVKAAADIKAAVSEVAKKDGVGIQATINEISKKQEEILTKSASEGLTGLLLVLAPAIVVLPAIILFIYYIICGDEDPVGNIASKKTEVEAIGKDCDRMADEMKFFVEELIERQVEQCQHDFNYKKDDFAQFLDYCQMNPEKLGKDSDLADLHYAFVGHWLDIFRDCSASPATKPWEDISKADYGSSCPRGLVATSRWVAKKLKEGDIDLFQLERITCRRKSGYYLNVSETDLAKKKKGGFFFKGPNGERMNMLPFLPSWVDCCSLNSDYDFTPSDEKPSEQRTSSWFPCEMMCGCYALKLQFLGTLHVAVFTYWFLLIPAGIWVFRLPYFVGANLIFLGWIMTTMVLGRIDKIMKLKKLDSQKTILMGDKRVVEQMHKDVKDFYDQCDVVMRCWTVRTRPRLDIMKQLTRKLMDTRWADSKSCRDFYKAIVEGLRSLDRGVGPLKYYCCDPVDRQGEMVSHDALMLVGRQLEKVAGMIRNNDAKDVARKVQDIMCIPNMLAVRVIAANDLPQGTWQAKYVPYVRLRAKQGGDWVRTMKQFNRPRVEWHSDRFPTEFRFLVEGLGQELECMVMDDNADGEDTFLGRTSLKIDHLTCGKWIFMASELECSEKDGSYLELEVMLARTVAELGTLMPHKPHELMQPSYESSSKGRKLMD